MDKKIYYCLSCCLLAPIAGVTQLPQGILGGQDNGAPWAAFLDSSGNLNPIEPTLLPPGGNILSVDINIRGMAILGGLDNNSNAYAALTQGPSNVITLNGLPSNSQTWNVAINKLGKGAIAVGQIPGGASGIYVASTTADGTLIPLFQEPGYATGAYSIDVNDKGYIIVGAQNGTNYALGLLFDPAMNLIYFHNGPPPGYYNAVAINSSSLSITGGGDGNSSGSWTSFVHSDGTEVPLPVSGGPIPATIGEFIPIATLHGTSWSTLSLQQTGSLPGKSTLKKEGAVPSMQGKSQLRALS